MADLAWIDDRLKQIRERMEKACHRAGRDPDEVKLLLATKTVSPEKIMRAVNAGETLLGENRVQELQEKFQFTENEKTDWHFIGHLQTNKVRHVVQYVSMVHSVDRIKLARTLDKQLKKENKQLDILIQVNTSYEDSKFGVAPEDALQLIEQTLEFDTLNIKGLMTIGKFSADPDDARKCFRLLKRVQQQVIDQKYPRVEMDVLSMGMSGDLEIAIEEGSTMVRVGTAVFGERIYPDSYYWNEQNPNAE